MISVIFVTGVPKYAEVNLKTLALTNPDVECIVIDDAQHKVVGWNRGAKIAKGDTLLFVDDDIIWTDKIIIPEFELFGPSLLSRNHIQAKGKVINVPNPWLDGWCIGASRRLYDEVGGFDEGFRFSGMQDADFCMMCAVKKVLPRVWKFPGKHLQAGTKYIMNPNHEKTRIDNIKYLVKKWKLTGYTVPGYLD